LMFLPPYSPDLNLIEESFSTLKAHLHHHTHHLHWEEDPINMLLEATSYITAGKCQEWIRHAGYITM
ncbi:hypothetical protein M404DRAFT_132341, partial [Pisolithus tinctorius Marx 270]